MEGGNPSQFLEQIVGSKRVSSIFHTDCALTNNLNNLGHELGHQKHQVAVGLGLCCVEDGFLGLYGGQCRSERGLRLFECDGLGHCSTYIRMKERRAERIIKREEGREGEMKEGKQGGNVGGKRF